MNTKHNHSIRKIICICMTVVLVVLLCSCASGTVSSGTQDSSQQETQNQENGNQETEFLKQILDSGLLKDYTELSLEDYASEYSYSLAEPDYLPESYELYDGVFIRQPDETQAEKLIIQRLWYDAQRNNALTVTEFIYDDEQALNYIKDSINNDVTVLDSDELGNKITNTYPWAKLYCYKEAVINDILVTGYLTASDNEYENECRMIVDSIIID